MSRVLESVLLALVALLGGLGARAAVEANLAAQALQGVAGDAAAVRAAGDRAIMHFVAGMAVLIVARQVQARVRRGADIEAPFSLPAAAGMLALGFCVQLGYGSPYATAWPGPPFGTGVLIASTVAAAILLLPGDLGGLLARARHAMAGLAVVLLLLLLFLGSAPGRSGQAINLWGGQPIEAVKLAAALAMGAWLGGRASRIRFHRERLGPLRIPRPRHLAGALAILVSTWLGLFAVRDLGPTLVLGLLFLGLFYVLTRSLGWLLLAVATIAALLYAAHADPTWLPSDTLRLRVQMWSDPWLNGQAHGDQLAAARWAMAAGGLLGSGVAAGAAGALPAGHTDLVYAHLVEVLGAAGALLYLGLLGVTVADALRVAAWNRTPERAMLAAAVALLVLAQALVILGGTLGAFPLTGVVVPFLSHGKSGQVAMLGAIALGLRLGENARARADTDELREVRAGVGAARAGALGVLAAVGVATAVLAAVGRDATSLRGVVTTLGDGTVVVRHDPRVQGIAERMRRGSILDRNGEPLAVSAAPGTRVNPLGDALGTVLGSGDAALARPAWSVERLLDTRLRGYPAAADPPVAWVASIGGRRRVVHARGPGEPEGEDLAAAKARELGAEGGVRRVVLADPDLSPLLAIARMPTAERIPAEVALANDVGSRSVGITLDAKLQRTLSKPLKEAAGKSDVGVAAVVVLDATTGQTLARAQWPDFDPGGTAWRPLRSADEAKFMGVYGAWSDKTGAHGTQQAGSVFKLVTALVSIREGATPGGLAACPAEAEPTFPCNQVDAGRPSFTLPGWSQPIHDSHRGGPRGDLDLVAALAESSNVYFAQLGLKLGPGPFRRLRADGVELGNPGLLDEADGLYTGIGEAGSRRLAQTAFGQGAGSWNVSQAARLVAAIGEGGVYRRCPASMEAGATCTEIPLLPPGTSTAPILAGMLAVMESGTGTGRKLEKVPGVRIYGKTGTADARGTVAEAPWGIRPGAEGRPHSWFVALAEAEAAESCASVGPRYAVAAVVPRGGFGAEAAGRLAVESIRALQETGYLPRP